MSWCRKEMETGHSPTKGFFNSLRARHSHENINEMEIDGKMTYDRKDIEQHVVQTYTKIINPPKQNYNEDHLTLFLEKHEVILPEIGQKIKDELANKITSEQIDDAVKTLRNDASPGPDGYCADIIKLIYQMIPHLFQEIGDDEDNETMTLQLKLRTMIFIPKTNQK